MLVAIHFLVDGFCIDSPGEERIELTRKVETIIKQTSRIIEPGSTTPGSQIMDSRRALSRLPGCLVVDVKLPFLLSDLIVNVLQPCDNLIVRQLGGLRRAGSDK